MNAAFLVLTATLLTGDPGCGCNTYYSAPAASCDSCCGHVSFFDRFRGVFAGHCNSCNTCAPVCETCRPVCVAPVCAPTCNTCDTCNTCGHSWRPGLFSGLFHRSCGCETSCAPACNSCGTSGCSTCGDAGGIVVSPGTTAPTTSPTAPLPTKMPAATPATPAPTPAPPPAKTTTPAPAVNPAPSVAPPPAKAPAPKGVNLQIESSPSPLAVPSYVPTIDNRQQQPAAVVPNSLRSPF